MESSTKAKKRPRTRRTQAWNAFSLYIRARDADANGMCRCCTCGKMVRWHGTKRCHAGHYISRRYNSTLFDEINVNSQCAECNKWKYGNVAEYERFLVVRYGDDILHELHVKSRVTKSYSDVEYMAIAEYYTKKANEIIETKKLMK